LIGLTRGVEILTEIPCPVARGDQLGIERIVEFAGEHFFAIGGHEVLPS
jgi:hypothetical protein